MRQARSKPSSFQSIIALGALALLPSLAPSARALDQIIEPYQTVREDGMGGVKLTTGEYDENFWGNPARVLDDPTWRISLLDLQLEVNSGFITNFNSFTAGSGGNTLSNVAGTTGSNNHGRLELAFPAYYLGKTNEHRKWSIALGLLASVQADIAIRQTYEVDPTVFADVGPALSFGYRLLGDSLGIGTTVRAEYRVAANTPVGLDNIINGNFSPSSLAGQGGLIDFDLGATYIIPVIRPLGVQLSAAATVNNVLGGNFNNFRLTTSGNLGYPQSQPRAFGVGVSGRRDSLGPFSDFVVAVEVQDIGNNGDGGPFRTVHIGAEARWSVLRPRVGINQGYLCAGLGIDAKALRIDLATYGEEMSLNPGGEEDRRYALRFSLQI